MIKAWGMSGVLVLLSAVAWGQDDWQYPVFELKVKPFHVLGEGHPEFSVVTDSDMEGLGVYASDFKVRRGGVLIYESGEDWSTDAADEVSFGWELLDSDGRHVGPGHYTITVEVTVVIYDGGGDYQEEFEGEFYILPSSHGDLVFRTTKTRYERNRPAGKDPVIFFVLNRGTRSVSLPTGRRWEILRVNADESTRRVAQNTARSRASVARNQAIIWEWDQREQGTLVRVGNYRAELRLSGGRVRTSNFEIRAN